ncbi:hypothetical protein H1D06_07090 [Mannheimia haemolytica]|uniref:phage tail termination protein n=1 Tax=Mannheimia haemolytica TaxID=75985 RepID=UPI001EFF322D|nr:hypothetical protein [Mannheimia haemolytica]ULX30128.1 hypothetical protein H1D07_12155 [Mannheimia haemolytica]ULX31561.1 hypothetical protein H1D06_07090 [Mannheimia haemolytica]ULX37719.1 hypothetical protein H1D04_03675 [Mannheimia haemolytica]ULX38670.1 hypothetical protein H1D03_08320 [Mannheimia haemolytica]ULX42563.1 hypothetical protein H1D02_05705 [Mannheimia haemolytica]
MISYVKAFKQWLEAHSLADGYVVQLYQWEDTQKAKPVIVIQPNSGSPQVSDLSSEHYLLISLVAGKNSGYTIEERAMAIMSKILVEPFASFGYIESMGGLPAPIFTEDNRMIFRLPLRIISTNQEE